MSTTLMAFSVRDVARVYLYYQAIGFGFGLSSLLMALASLALSCSLLFGFPAFSLFHTLYAVLFIIDAAARLFMLSFLFCWTWREPNTIHNMQVQA